MNGTGFTKQKLLDLDILPPNNMTEDDRMCGKCLENLKKYLKLNEEKFVKPSEEQSTIDSSMETFSNPTTKTDNTSKVSNTSILNLSHFTSAEQLREMTKSLHDQTKANWDKNGVVQYKDEGLVILQRMWGQQVQFIVACSQVTKEGYRLMTIDEGKSGGQSSGGFTGGVNAYFYFQKMDYVR
jgi:hypothetical protein